MREQRLFPSLAGTSGSLEITLRIRLASTAQRNGSLRSSASKTRVLRWFLSLSPVPLAKFYQHMCTITEAISVDSASNELTSARELCSWHPDLGLKFLSNCRFILRDVAHSARRILGRGFGADPVLEDTLGLFVHWKHSLGQMIHHSIDMQRLYVACCSAASSDSAVTTKFANMRSAKHRIETYTTPLSRCILNMSGLLPFLVKVCSSTQGQGGWQSGRGFPRGSIRRLAVAGSNDVRR